jgi:hypothetical protein
MASGANAVRSLGAVTIGLFLVVRSGSPWSELRSPLDAEINQSKRAAGEETYWLLAAKSGKFWWAEGETLHYVLGDGTQGSLPLRQLDLLFTEQPSRGRGEEFRLPKPPWSSYEAKRGSSKPWRRDAPSAVQHLPGSEPPVGDRPKNASQQGRSLGSTPAGPGKPFWGGQ